MKLIWEPEERDIAKVKALWASYAEHSGSKKIIQTNIMRSRLDVSTDNFWKCVVAGLLEISPYHAYNRRIRGFRAETLVQLSLQLVYLTGGSYHYIYTALRKDGEIRHPSALAESIAETFILLDVSKWALWHELKTLLTENDNREVERQAAQSFAAQLGLSPFRSRKILYSIVVLKYEIPIYPKHLNWLKTLPLPFALSFEKLKKEDYYTFICDCFIALSESAGIYPCQLDTAIMVGYTPKPVKKRKTFHLSR